MRIAFFVSSIGDTDLAKATISKLINQNIASVCIIPLTETAIKRTNDLPNNRLINRIVIDEIIRASDNIGKKLDQTELDKMSKVLQGEKIQRIYVGVPSIDNEIPFQIAEHVDLPCIIAYEYMFKPKKHTLWDHVNRLANKPNCEFVVTLKDAKNDILALNANANIYEIGHLSVDQAESANTIDVDQIKASLMVNLASKLIFISGTTQQVDVDNQFLNALLKELATGNYPAIQLRMGLHPGVKDADTYMQTLLKTCANYPQTKAQFKLF